MAAKLYSHKVTIADKKRQRKRTTDMAGKAVSRRALFQAFNTYYKGPVSALYKTIFGDK